MYLHNWLDVGRFVIDEFFMEEYYAYGTLLIFG